MKFNKKIIENITRAFRIFLIVILCFSVFSQNVAHIITNQHVDHVGGDMAFYIFAKIMSLKYNIKFALTPFEHSDLFKLDLYEEKLGDTTGFEKEGVQSEKNIVSNLEKSNFLFVVGRVITDIKWLSDIQPIWLNEIKKCIHPKDTIVVHEIPPNMISVAMHIRPYA